MGYFITFEGIEGCGKTTQIRLLADCLEAAGHRTLLTREPGGCPISDQVRAILLDAGNAAMEPVTELLLYAAARAQHVAEVIMPALKSGRVVLCDRFSDATLAYQSTGRGIERAIIDTLNSMACRSLHPDLTVLMDCDVSVGLTRAKRRIAGNSGPREERFELEALPFHQRVRDGYLRLAAAEPGRFITIDAGGGVEEIAGQISAQVLRRLNGQCHAVR